MDRRAAELVDQACDGTLSESELAELDALLADDPRVRQYYVEQVDLHTNLYFNMAAKAAGARAVSRTKSSAPVKAIDSVHSRQWWVTAMVAVAAAVMLVAGLIAWRDGSGDGLVAGGIAASAPPPVVATFHDGVAAALRVADGVAVPEGDLRATAYELESGLAELRFPDGTGVLVGGPADFTLIDKHSVQLDRGRVHVRMAPGTSGFRVLSDGLEVTDLGTEFGVWTADEDYAEVHVFDGSVMVRTIDDDGLGRDSLKLEAWSRAYTIR
jgi:ferric-dicitrate binding protein FerR (iron transport regulator)